MNKKIRKVLQPSNIAGFPFITRSIKNTYETDGGGA
jgi:hypothetical protein